MQTTIIVQGAQLVIDHGIEEAEQDDQIDITAIDKIVHKGEDITLLFELTFEELGELVMKALKEQRLEDEMDSRI